MKKVKECIICGESTPSSLPIASYCVRCRGVVMEIKRQVKAAMGNIRDIPYDAVCVDCGRPATCMDHRYYSLPLEVDFVCDRCNINRGPALDVVERARKMLGLDKQKEVELESSKLDNQLAMMEKNTVRAALAENRGNQAAAARDLGISYRSIRYRIKRLGIEV